MVALIASDIHDQNHLEYLLFGKSGIQKCLQLGL